MLHFTKSVGKCYFELSVDFLSYVAPLHNGLLPAGPVHFTDPVNFHGKDYVNLPMGLSPNGAPGSRYIKIKGKNVTSLNVSLYSAEAQWCNMLHLLYVNHSHIFRV